MNRSRATNLFRETVLTVAALLGACCIVATILGLALGIQPLVFRSGSMAPAISTGALALARTVPANTLGVGDVVSVHNAAGVRVTHRIVAVSPQPDGRVLLTLKGDANIDPDAETYPVRDADRLLVSVSWLGYLTTGLSSRPVVFLAGVLLGGVSAGRLNRRPAADRADRAPVR